MESDVSKSITAGKTVLPNRTIKDSVFRDLFSQPEWISLSEEFFPSKKSLDLKAKVLCGNNGDNILDQYITFTKILDEQVRKNGRTQETVAEGIRICKGRKILKAYLESREKEVIGIMMTLFDQEYLYGISLKEAREEGSQSTQRSNALRMHEQGCSADSIAKMLDLSIDIVNEWLSGETVLA